MTYTYIPKGVCSSRIDLELEGDTIQSVSFTGGCNGNLQGICRLVKGMKAQEAVDKLQGIQCGYKPTSCPDQLSRALTEAVEAAKKAWIQRKKRRKALFLCASGDVKRTWQNGGRPHDIKKDEILARAGRKTGGMTSASAGRVSLTS